MQAKGILRENQDSFKQLSHDDKENVEKFVCEHQKFIFMSSYTNMTSMEKIEF